MEAHLGHAEESGCNVAEGTCVGRLPGPCAGPRGATWRAAAFPRPGQVRSSCRGRRSTPEDEPRRGPGDSPLPPPAASSARRPSRTSTRLMLRWLRSLGSRSRPTALCMQLRSRLPLSRAGACHGHSQAPVSHLHAGEAQLDMGAQGTRRAHPGQRSPSSTGPAPLRTRAQPGDGGKGPRQALPGGFACTHSAEGRGAGLTPPLCLLPGFPGVPSSSREAHGTRAELTWLLRGSEALLSVALEMSISMSTSAGAPGSSVSTSITSSGLSLAPCPTVAATEAMPSSYCLEDGLGASSVPVSYVPPAAGGSPSRGPGHADQPLVRPQGPPARTPRFSAAF